MYMQPNSTVEMYGCNGEVGCHKEMASYSKLFRSKGFDHAEPQGNYYSGPSIIRTPSDETLEMPTQISE